MPATLKALLVKNNAITPVDLPIDEDQQLKEMNKLLGGYLASCFRFHSNGLRTLQGYCDDDGYVKGRKDFSCVPQPGVLRQDVWPIAGPVLICAVGPEGETVSMTEEEQGIWELLTLIEINGKKYTAELPFLCVRES